jgi:hypothetical protein
MPVVPAQVSVPVALVEHESYVGLLRVRRLCDVAARSVQRQIG